MDKPCASAFSRKIELRTCNEIPEEEKSKIKKNNRISHRGNVDQTYNRWFTWLK